MIKHKKKIMLLVMVLLIFITNMFSAETGDALQLLSYRTDAVTEPDITDGQIAPVTNPRDWRSAYVRYADFDEDGISVNPHPTSVLISNDNTYLYLAVAITMDNAAASNRLNVYFDLDTRNSLDTDSEYFISMLADGSAPYDGYWDGNNWIQNTIPVVQGTGLRKGAGSTGWTSMYNYEFRIPLNTAGDASNSYLNINPGDEIGVIFEEVDNTGTNYYWVQTNADPTDPSATGANGNTGWGEIKTIGDGIADRNMVSLAAKGILPTIDGNVSGDANWKYSYSKNVVFTDYNGNKLNGTIKVKEEYAPNRMILGIIVEDYTPIAADFLSFYNDQGATGNDRDFVLTQGGDPVLDNAVRMYGTGTMTDYNFDTADWVADITDNGSGAASVSGLDWEIELEIPFLSGNPDDLSIDPQNVLGALFHLYDSTNDINYWLSSTINTEKITIDPEDQVFNALGWIKLQTGGPFVQSIYPETGDTISGEYPLAVYTVDPTDAVPELGINNVTYEVRLEDPAAGTYTVLRSGTMNKVEDDNIPIWTATLDTRTIIQPLNTLMKLVYIVEDGEIDPVSVPLDIYINNDGGTGQLSDPDCVLNSPLPHVELSGSGNALNFTVNTDSMLTIDSVMVFIDGELMSSYAPVGVYTYSDTYLWDTSNLPDGEHIIQIWGKNSLNITNYSPSTLVYTDNNAPMGVVTVDKDYVKNADNVLFEYHGTEPNLTVALSLAQLQLLDNNATAGLTLVDPDMNGVYTASHLISADNSVADGTVTLTFSVIDRVGNTFSPSLSFTLDNILPSLTQNVYPTPVSNEVFVRNILLDCSYFDTNIESIVIRHTNASGNDVNNSPLSIQLSDDNAFSRTLEMIDGTNNINVTLIDKSGNILSEDTALIYTDPRVTNIIGESGGIVTSPDGTIVDIPAGALLSDEEITIMTISTEGLPQPYDGSGITLLKNAHKFGPENLIFHEPVTISLSYNDFDLDLDQDGADDISENEMNIFYLDGNTWIKTVADDNDIVNNLVTFTTNHFSVYALGTQTPTTDIKVYWTKNPFSANNYTTLVAELVDPGTVSLKIYDMSGDLVRAISDNEPVSGSYSRNWDGKNDYDNYVGSGIYIYVFEYENSATGAKEIIKKPIGVIK